MSAADRALSALRSLDVTTDTDILEAHRRDQAATSFLQPGWPSALVRPRSAQDVQTTLRAAHEHGIPVVPRGAGSGLSGGANAIDGAWIVVMDQMKLVTIDPDGLLAVAQPGTINDAVRAAAAGHGLLYPPDPASASFSTIGGNIATNAGGLCCVKHGVTRDFVLGLEVVLADGELVRLGGRSRKNVAGYDLVSLLCGSEGTLGIITEANLRLIPDIRGAATLAASFPHIGDAGRAVATVMRRFVPSLLELMDRTSINAVADAERMDLDRNVDAMVFARADEGLVVVEQMAQIFADAGASTVVTSDEAAEGRVLMAARRLAYPALERRGATLLDDVGVPLNNLQELLEGVQRIAERHAVLIGTFGHAGDGNMHPTIVYDRDDEDSRRRARLAFLAVLDLALELDGTITGEHGVGVLKRDRVEAQLGAGHGINLVVKQALDPRGILNPGKAL